MAKDRILSISFIGIYIGNTINIANAYTAASPPIGGYTVNGLYNVTFNVGNTGSATLDGYTLLKDGIALVGGEFTSNEDMLLRWDGTFFNFANGPGGATGAAAGILYKYDVSLSGSPTIGFFQFDSDDFSSASQLFINPRDQEGNDQSNLFNLIGSVASVHGLANLYLYDEDSAISSFWLITSVSLGPVYTLGGEYISGVTSLPNNANTRLTVALNGNDGTIGATGPAGPTGAIGPTGPLLGPFTKGNIYVADGTKVNSMPMQGDATIAPNGTVTVNSAQGTDTYFKLCRLTANQFLTTGTIPPGMEQELSIGLSL